MHITLGQKSDEVSFGDQTSIKEILKPTSVPLVQKHSEKEDMLKKPFEIETHVDTDSQTLKEKYKCVFITEYRSFNILIKHI